MVSTAANGRLLLLRAVVPLIGHHTTMAGQMVPQVAARVASGSVTARRAALQPGRMVSAHRIA